MTAELASIENIYSIIKENTIEKEQEWLNKKLLNPEILPIAFVSVPRFISKRNISNQSKINDLVISNWTLDRLVRVYLLLVFEQKSTEANFIKSMENLFETAEINESVALLSALPYFQQPEKWLHRATDAVRSNIGDVFDALAFNNIYPSKYFSELAWNQLVLKCIFNFKPVHKIVGLSNRINRNLASVFSDLAHERWAAGRSVPAAAWQLVVPFVDDTICSDLETLFKSGDLNNKIAAALVCKNTDNLSAVNLIAKYPLSAQENGKLELGWNYFS